MSFPLQVKERAGQKGEVLKMVKFSPVYFLPSLGFTEYLFLSLQLQLMFNIILLSGMWDVLFWTPKDSVEVQVWVYMERAQATQGQI